MAAFFIAVKPDCSRLEEVKRNYNNRVLNKVTGVILLVVGSLLILWGYNESESLGSHLTRLYSGNPTQNTLFYYLGGGVCLLLGAINLLRR